MNKKNIAIVTHSFFGIGGAENNIQTIVKELLKMDYKVTIFVPKKTLIKKENEGLNLIPVPDSVFNIEFKNILYDYKNKYSTVKNILKLNFDHVHFSMVIGLMALFPFFNHKSFSIGCRDGSIFDPKKHGYLDFYNKHKEFVNYKGIRTTMFGNFFLKFFFHFYKKKAKFIAISEEMKLELFSLGVPCKNVSKIVNGIDTKRFRKILKSTKIQKKKKLFYILAVGRNDSRKGFILLINTAENLIKNNINFKFIIKGRGFEKFLEIIKEKNLNKFFCIYDLGFNIDFQISNNTDDITLPDSNTVSLYKFADLIVIPSILESLSNVGLESEVANKPMVVSDSTGCNEYIKRGTAIGFEKGSSLDLARKIILIKNNKVIRKRLNDARKFWQNKSSIELSVEKYLKLFFKNE